MGSFFRGLCHAYRSLLKNPGFTTVAVLSLALGIGANTAIFSFINSVVLRDLPVREPKQLVLFGNARSAGIASGAPDASMELFSWQQYRAIRSRNKTFDDVLAINSMPQRLYLAMNDSIEPVEANAVSGNYFDSLGVRPAAGRFFEASADTKVDSSPYVVLSYDFWQSHFDRSTSVIGQTVRMANRQWTVIGVAPRGFFGMRLGGSPDIWLPLSMQSAMPGFPTLLNEPLSHFLVVVGRFKHGVSMAQAQAEANVLLQQILPGELRPGHIGDDLAHIRRARIDLTPGARGYSPLRETYQETLRILMLVVVLVLVIACANVANLLLALAARRRKEFALRVALGAKRSQIVKQLLTESLLLSGCGGLLGVLFAAGAGRLLIHLISTGPRAVPLDVDLDGRVLAFTALISIATGVLFGLAPALRASRVDLNESLKESKASMASPRKVTFGRVLVSLQVALSLGLLVTAGLLLHSFTNLLSISTGFQKENVLIFKLDTESSGYGEDERIARLYQDIESRVSGIPGVSSQGVSLFSFHEGQRTTTFTAEGTNLPESVRTTSVNYVSPGYFSTLHIPMLLGRTLNAHDTAAGMKVAVASESFAKAIFGDPARALGRTIMPDDEKKEPVQIVGIARDTKNRTLRDRDSKMIWRSVYQTPVFLHNLAVRVTGDTSRVAASVRQAIQSTDRNLPIRWTTTLADEVSDSLVRERAIAQLSTFFAALALALSAIGLYGTISFAVAHRTNEIGIRMALGAGRTGVVGMVLRDAMMLTAVGILAGLPLALIAGTVMNSMLYGMATVDAASVTGSVVVLSLIAALAGYIPARRAAAVDPMIALRYE